MASVCLADALWDPNISGPRCLLPPAWKAEGPWREAAPKDAIPKGAWWEIFHDEELSRYEQQLLAANQSLAAARRSSGSGSFAGASGFCRAVPHASAPIPADREIGIPEIARRLLLPERALTQSVYEIPFALNYEVDLFGQVRKNLQASNASLQGTAADLQNVQLVLTAELAADYFSLRELDSETQVVQESVKIQQEGLALVNHRHEGGIASGLDLAQQQTLLDSTVTQLYLAAAAARAVRTCHGGAYGKRGVHIQRSGRVRCARLPRRFRWECRRTCWSGVPMWPRRNEPWRRRTHWLELPKRRSIRNSPFPAPAGSKASALDRSLPLPVRSGRWAAICCSPSSMAAAIGANLAATKSAYDESVANYRESVLTAFQQVEDSLSGLNSLSQAAGSQNAAVTDARRALEIANDRYVGGLTTFLDVITAQSVLLTNERLSTQLLGQQMVTSVLLVKALGGGWDASAIQNEQVHPTATQVLQP